MNVAHIGVIHKLTISFEDILQSSLTVLVSSTSLELPTSGSRLVDLPEDATPLLVSFVERLATLLPEEVDGEATVAKGSTAS